MRVDETSGYVPASEAPGLSRAERDRLCVEFLDSPEGQGFAPDSEEAYATLLAIDSCADYVDGRPPALEPRSLNMLVAGWNARSGLA